MFEEAMVILYEWEDAYNFFTKFFNISAPITITQADITINVKNWNALFKGSLINI